MCFSFFLGQLLLGISRLSPVIMKLRVDYPELANFLGAWFPDADLEGRTDTEAAIQFKRTATLSELNSAIKQGKRLLNEENFPWEAISVEANRCFTNAKEAKRWLGLIIAILEAEAE